MSAVRKPILALTAADLMTREVVAIPVEASMRTAARSLARAHVSGAPAVDGEGRCVGVLSAADYLHGVVNENLELAPTDKVGEHMTADPVTVSPATPARQLARMMLDAGIHRVIVVDEQRRPVGVVSSTDLLAALVCADSDAGSSAAS